MSRKVSAARRTSRTASPSLRDRALRAASGSALENLETRRMFAMFTVGSALDDGAAGTLREAILAANANPGPDVIAFDLGGSATIAPLSPLPAITDTLIIDGTTQVPGVSDTGDGPLVHLSGELTGGDGLVIAAPDSVVRGLVINGFSGAGVRVATGGDRAVVMGNYIGTDPTGTFAVPNSDGVAVDAPAALISGNVISGNDLSGVNVSAGGTGARIAGNRIGTDAAGVRPLVPTLLNFSFGVTVNGAAGVVVGGSEADRNTIAGNGREAVDLHNAPNALVSFNHIGTDHTGAFAVGNGAGVAVSDASDGAVVRDNLISAVWGSGVLVSSASGVLVAGNTIGTVTVDSLGSTEDEFFMTYLVQGNGIEVEGASANVTVGGPAAADRNVLAGGQGTGIVVDGTGAGNLVEGNYVGVMADGSTMMGWWGNGVELLAPGVTLRGNVVGGADGSGVVVRGNGAVVTGNFIGVGPDGVTPVPNLGADGVFVDASGATVSGNVIANNAVNGVTVASGTGNRVSQNSIFANGALGIDLGIDGVTANDSLGHAGPNAYQNFPVFTGVLRLPTAVLVKGTLTAAPNKTYMVELFANAAASPTGHGEGATFLGTVAVVTNSAGVGTFAARVNTPAGQDVVTATATDAAGNTSEFSLAATVPSTITRLATTTSLSSSANPAAFGDAVTFTAAVTNPDGAIPGGVVTFFRDGAPIGTGTLNASGVATLAVSDLAVGGHTITAEYAAQGDFDASSSAPLNQRVVAATTTGLSVSAPSSHFGDAVTLTATVSPSAATGTVTFKDGDTVLGTATLDNGVATLVTTSLGAGQHALTAEYAGSADYLASASAPVAHSVSVLTSTSVSVSSPTSVYGNAVTLTATVSAATGSVSGLVTFKDGDTVLGTATAVNGVATLVVSTFGAGNHSIAAEYAGAGVHEASASAPAAHRVFVSTSTSLTSSANPATEGQAVVFTATVTAPVDTPTGFVTFKDGDTVLGTVPVDAAGIATLSIDTLSLGGHAITATFAATGDFLDSAAAPLAQTVNARPVTDVNTNTSLTSSANPALFGQTVTFTATVTPATGSAAPTGMVTFKDGNTVLATVELVDGVATFSTDALAGGSHTITAVYAGQGNFLGSMSAPLAQTVNVATTTGLAVSSPNSTVGQTVTFTATVSAPSGVASGVVTFTDGDAILGTANLVNGVATLTVANLARGAHNVTATYAGSGAHLASASTPVTHTVAVATATTLTSSAHPASFGNPLTFTATVTSVAGVPTGVVNFFDGNTFLGSGTLNASGVATLTTTGLSVGSHTITAAYAGAGDFLPSASAGLHQAVNAKTKTDVATSTNPAVVGQGVTLTATVTSPNSGATGTVTFYAGNTVLGTGALNPDGTASLVTASLGRGSHAIKAVYAGQGNYEGSASAPIAQAVYAATTTTLSVSTSSNSCRHGDTVTFSARVTAPAGAGTPTGLVTFYDGNTVLGTGVVNAQGVATLTTGSLGVGTHTIKAVYGGSTQNYFLGSTSAPLAYTVKSTKATIGGTVYRDLSGNGLSDDDVALRGVTVRLFVDRNRNGRIDSNDGAAVATDVSDADGGYRFGNLSAARYLVQQITPDGHVRTAPALTDTYSISASAGDEYTNLDFANYKKCNCAQNVTGIVYIIRGRTYTDLRGRVREGDTVTVKFTVKPGAAVTLSLVSYTAPGSEFVAADADEQRIYDLETGTFSTGTHTMTVKIPPSFFQVDFVCGLAIDQFGPAGSNVFYSAQGRLFSADNGGTHSADGVQPLV